jgi:general stress protein CsbA
MSTSTYDALFKETAGGYLFRAPNPWLFGAGKHYLTNDSQRAEILEIGKVRYPVVSALAFVLAIVACPLGSTLVVYLLSGHAEPDGTDVGAIVLLTVVSLVVSLLVVTQPRYRRLRPILMRLPRSDQKLTLRDIQKTQLKAISLKKLLILGAVLAASAVVQAISLAFIVGMDVGARRHVAFGSSQLLSVCVMLLQGGVAAVFFKRAASRVRGDL